MNDKVIYLDLERDTTFRTNLYYIQNMEEERNIFSLVSEWYGKFLIRPPPPPQIGPAYKLVILFKMCLFQCFQGFC